MLYVTQTLEKINKKKYFTFFHCLAHSFSTIFTVLEHILGRILDTTKNLHIVNLESLDDYQ